jgi:hypothetical protein
VGVPVETGAIGASLPAPTVNASGRTVVTAAAAASIPAPGIAASGTVVCVGTGSASIGAPQVSASGRTVVTSTIGAQLAAPQVNASGIIGGGVIGAIAVSIPAPTVNANNQVPLPEWAQVSGSSGAVIYRVNEPTQASVYGMSFSTATGRKEP